MQTLEALFAKLGSRPHLIESNQEFEILSKEQYKQLVGEIEKGFTSFPPDSVWKVADKYENWIIRILITLTPQTSVESVFKIQPTKIKNSANTSDLNLLARELTAYQLSLDRIKMTAHSLRQDTPKTITHNSNLPPQLNISLPENFTVKDIQKHFTPLLGERHIGTLLSILRDEKLIPSYDAKSLGILASNLFGKSSDNIRKNISISSSKEELQELKQILQTVISKIDSHIKSSK